MSTNPFQTAEAWEVSTGRLLGEGNHLVKIDSADNGTSSGGHPQIELQLSNADGEIRDWLVITQASVGKVVALAQAAGVRLPEDTDLVDRDALRLTDEWVFLLVGKSVGAVVREETSYKDANKKVPRVQGYVEPSRIKGTEDNGNAFVHPSTPADKSVPF